MVDPAQLLNAVSAIQAGNTQREILRALLDQLVHYSGRAALFVMKSGTATGWQGRGFSKDDEDPIKDVALDVTTGLAEQALQSRKAMQRDRPMRSMRSLLPSLVRPRMAGCCCCPWCSRRR